MSSFVFLSAKMVPVVANINLLGIKLPKSSTLACLHVFRPRCYMLDRAKPAALNQTCQDFSSRTSAMRSAFLPLPSFSYY